MQMGQSQTFGNQKEQWAMLGPSKTGTLLNCDKQTFRFQVALVGGSPKIVINYHYSVYTNVMYSLSFSLSIYIPYSYQESNSPKDPVLDVLEMFWKDRIVIDYHFARILPSSIFLGLAFQEFCGTQSHVLMEMSDLDSIIYSGNLVSWFMDIHGSMIIYHIHSYSIITHHYKCYYEYYNIYYNHSTI